MTPAPDKTNQKVMKWIDEINELGFVMIFFFPYLIFKALGFTFEILKMSFVEGVKAARGGDL